VNVYDRLISAITFVESSNGKNVFNAAENAIGSFQIRKCRIDDFNKKTGKNYSHEQMYNYELAREVFLFYCKGRSYEAVARGWCSGDAGTKKASESYWRKVKAKL